MENLKIRLYQLKNLNWRARSKNTVHWFTQTRRGKWTALFLVCFFFLWWFSASIKSNIAARQTANLNQQKAVAAKAAAELTQKTKTNERLMNSEKRSGQAVTNVVKTMIKKTAKPYPVSGDVLKLLNEVK